MDERDCRILMELTRAPFDSFEAMGRRIGVSGTSVKARLHRLAENDIFHGFACGPSAQALGKHARLAVWSQSTVSADLATLARIDDVAWAACAYPAATVVMLYRDDARAPVPDELAKAAGRAPDSVVSPNDPSASRKTLSPLDWRVMRSVMDAPRAPVRAIADATGLSARTVRARRDAMFASGDLMAFVKADATREEGAFLYSAYVGAASIDALRGLRIANAQRIVTHHDPPGTFLTGYVRTYAEAHVVEEKLRAIPGAKDVSFSVPQGTVAADERLRGWVDAQIKKWDAARRAPLGS